MAWRDTLVKLRDSVAKARTEKQREAETLLEERRDHRMKLQEMANSLGITLLLTEMNTVLMEGHGEVETFSSWEPLGPLLEVGSILPGFDDDDEDDDDFEEDDVDVTSSVLSWDEGGERELVVDLGWDEDGMFLEVNGEETRHERTALERALVQAFKDELGL
ncbi:MAG: hypothetical protein EXR54_05680 [Dehalococcoidia bacterium]|nr:hypothetical protein [Dehalococcoidia bacterium]MSQ17046.1 hypothetical protein [Dehalococcoidia bacterium]